MKCKCIFLTWMLGIAAGFILCAFNGAAAEIDRTADYQIRYVVKPSSFHGIHGGTFDGQGRYYIGSLIEQTTWRLDPAEDRMEVFIGPPMGMTDDMEFAADGTYVWNATWIGKVFAMKPGRPPYVIAENLPGVNAIAFDQKGRCFVSLIGGGQDKLMEVFLDGKTPPRLIMEGIGMANGFDFGPDGLLYAPLVVKNTLVSINVDTKEIKTISGGFLGLGAVNFDSKGNLWMIDTGRGQVLTVDINTGEQTLICQVESGLDNLAIDAGDRVWVCNMTNGHIFWTDLSGDIHTVRKGYTCIPAGLDVYDQNGETILYVADSFAYRTMSALSGQTINRHGILEDLLALYSFNTSVYKDTILISSFVIGWVLVVDRDTETVVKTITGLKSPQEIELLKDGRILVAEQGTNNLLIVSGEKGENRKIAADGLEGIQGLAVDGDNAYVTEYNAGKVTRVNLVTGEKKEIVANLDGPEGLDIGPDRKLYVAETGKKRLIIVNPDNGEIEVIRTGLRIGMKGWEPGPASFPMPDSFIPTGVSVAADGAIYVSSDVSTGIYEIEKK